MDNPLVRALLKPGLWLQKLTTREPDDSQLEVALSALRKVVELDQAAENPPATQSEPVTLNANVEPPAQLPPPTA
jgi:uncharacterized protein YqhQ